MATYPELVQRVNWENAQYTTNKIYSDHFSATFPIFLIIINKTIPLKFHSRDYQIIS